MHFTMVFKETNYVEGVGALKTMHSLLRIVCVAAAVVIACSHARAAEKTMTIDFVGDWCFDSQDKNVSWYKLPSWTEGGH